MYKSLCNNDFYPLIHKGAKWMSYDDKVTYRAKHSIPDTIDEWIAIGKAHTVAPTTNPHKRGPSREYPLWQDNVECILNVICKEGHIEGVVQSPDVFTLTLRVRVPPTTNFLMHYWHSPTMIIDQYMGESRPKFSPDWLETVKTERRFWQSRTLMLAMMLYFVRNIPHNSKVKRRVASWCSAMSVPVSGLLTWVRPPISPRHMRSHKPRASDLPAEESQKLGKTLNTGSLRRTK